jgi:hypothetical protein
MRARAINVIQSQTAHEDGRPSEQEGGEASRAAHPEETSGDGEGLPNAGAEGGSKDRCSMTANLPLMMLDDPGPFETLETWEQFLAEVEAMPDFHGKAGTIDNAKWLIAQKEQELSARRHGSTQ